jgi:hypothetical protein
MKKVVLLCFVHVPCCMVSACGEINTVIITQKYPVLQGFKTVIRYILLCSYFFQLVFSSFFIIK